MLWSLLKVLIFVGLVAGAVFGLDYLFAQGDVATLQVAGREFVLTPILVILLVLAVLITAWVIFKVVGLLVALLRAARGDETALTRYFGRRKERKGYEALAEGMMALAAGEGRLAIRKANNAERYLGRPELTKLVVAQGAEMVGDRQLATETFKELVTNTQTRFVGVRGLMKQKLADGDTDTAMKLAEKAIAIRPGNGEVQTTLLQLQAQAEDWTGARATLSQALKSGNLPRDVHSRREAILALAHARDAMAEGKIAEAKRDANSANKMAPGLVPAAAMAARLAISEGNTRQANKILKKAWDEAPHPDLAAAFAEIAPNETPTERLRRFRPLIQKHADQAESQLLEAELHIAAEDFPSARRALGDLAVSEPTARSLTIMAAIERGEGAEDRVVSAWLARAVTASRGPQWICDVDGKAYPEWQPVTDGGIDTLTWKTMPQSEAALIGPAAMLPLIVGSIEDQSSATDDAEVVEAETVEGAADVIVPPTPEGTTAETRH